MSNRIFISCILILNVFYAHAQKGKKNTGELYYPIVNNGLYGYIQYSGSEVIAPAFQWADYFYHGLAAAKEKGKYGFINPKGEWVVPAEYDTVRRFSDGMAAVAARGNDSIVYWSYVDTLGNILQTNLQGICSETDFHNDRAVVFLCGGDFTDYIIINRKGETVFKFDKTYYADDTRPAAFSEGYMRVVLPDNSKTFVDTSGKLWDKGTFQDVGDFKEGLAWFFENGNYGFIDKQGKVVIPAKFEAVSDFSEGLAKTTEHQELDPETFKLKGGVVGYINKEGKYIASPQYQEGGDYHNGFALVKLNGLYGFLNKDGAAVINFQFADAKSFFRELAYVKLDSRWQYINMVGKKVW